MNKGWNNTDTIPNVTDLLGIGKENAILQRDICEKLRCTPAEFKAAVQRFRRTNTDRSKFICSDGNGYYIAKNRAEIERFVSSISKQAVSRFETIKEAKRMLKGDPDGEGELHGSFQG